ncbi:MAG: radical SAM protein [Candidatus Riflebacteria bacterium]|nr:radical SAM protein [Candidatus Riflebacteria bacterium]
MKKAFPDLTVPKTAVLELTSRCNHRCVFCSTPWDADSPVSDKFSCADEMSTAQWQECIDFMLGKNIYGFAFTGGEPFLRPDLFELIDYVKARSARHPEFAEDGRVCGHFDKPLELTIISNGRLINADHAARLKNKVDAVVVSLPGLKSYAELTGGGDSAEALRAISLLSQQQVPVVVSICVSTKNLPELFENISAGFLAGADQLLLNRFLPGGRGTIHQELCLSAEQIKQMLKIADEVCTAANRYGSIGTELPLCLCNEEYKMLTVGTQCSGGVEFFAVAPDGSVRPCNHSPVNLGHYSALDQAIASDYWQTFKNRDYLPEMCNKCQHMLECDGGCREAAHIVGGALNSPDPIFMS